MSNPTQRPALGQTASIGTFYDARADTFLPRSLFNKELPAAGILTSKTEKKVVQVSYVDLYGDKFEKMGVGNELGGSILAGMVNPTGSGRYLNEALGSRQTLQAAVHHKITTVQEKLNVMSDDVKDCLGSTSLRTSEVTHIVTGIEWGVKSVVTARHHMPPGSVVPAADGQFRGLIEAFKTAVETSSPLNPGVTNGQMAEGMSLDITAYSDILDNEGIIMHDFEEASQFLDLMPLHIKDENGGKGKPITYTLLPISMLSMFLPIEINFDLTAEPPSTECLKRFLHLFDEFKVSQQKLNDYQLFVSNNKPYLSEDHARDVAERVQRMKSAEDALRANYTVLLKGVRSGAVEPEKLWELLRSFALGDSSPKKILTVEDGHREKAQFASMMVAKGATYIGYNGLDLNTELSGRRDVDAYVFSFNDVARQDPTSWQANQNLLLELLNEPNRRSFVAIVDYDATSTSLEKSHISHFQNGQAVSSDLLEQRQFLEDKCFARYNEHGLETQDIQKPLKRRFVKIECPGRNCSQNGVCEWICYRCHAPIEYGYSDQYIYCDCGRSPINEYDFKCNSELHGPGFDVYDPNILLSRLKSLDQTNYLNVLILGETGVGKSTFINAFVNYLTFETLDDAKKAEELNWVIPCSFSTQTMDRSNPDRKIEEIKVQVGSRDDESDGSKGASATQRTTVYPVTIGSSTIRLIDTPGIGDTRGLAYDQQNMADILSTLSSYDELHGVLILLKSNNARLTVTFSFCVTELLTHLHRSAAANMVFGFTNTRISNYTPGDTFGPLNTLLARHPGVGLSLSVHTTYCFDSESFRYLAAFKNNVFMDNEEDFRRSWKHSREEALRLIDHFKTRIPHEVRSTISLNGTRELIAELTKPMADISQLIKTNIALCDDQIQDLQDHRLGGDQLRKKLHLQKVQLNPETLAKPRTVCKDQACTEFKDDGNGEGNVVTIYKTHCHKICYLTDVKADHVAHPGLIHCAAFNGSNYCTTCSHHWQQHMHVLYELKESTATVTDTEIERQLRTHASDVQLKQTAIKELQQMILEYENEHEQIRKAAAQFGMFLKKYSITAYNDKTIEYLKFLIKDEEAKIRAGGNRKKLQALEEDLKKHQETVNILEDNMRTNANWQPLDEKGVDRLIKQLYNLKHFGNNLRNVKQTTAAAHQATYREIPYRVKNRGSSSSMLGPFAGLFGGSSHQSSHSKRSHGGSHGGHGGHGAPRHMPNTLRHPQSKSSSSRPPPQTFQQMSQLPDSLSPLPSKQQESVGTDAAGNPFGLPILASFKNWSKRS
ncbi:hypothetical protein G7Y89_g6371 [Cudoniella acicularis]|uniref:G domain-containing protein n=1 Tax=Cudoniella acicularis TaxID=354080 RepID=A0A8H4W2I0_9HELO|nr:hypothetical protein G7Y89_g6371 [Cudoniella acicularis]